MTPQPARAFDVYDAFGIGPWPQPDRSRPCPIRSEGGYMRIFGSANIGVPELCNLQVPGQILHDHGVARIGNMYARHDHAALEDLTESQRRNLDRFTTTTTVTLRIRDRFAWQGSLAGLLAKAPWPTPVEGEDVDAWFRTRTVRGTPLVQWREDVTGEIAAFGGQVHRLMEDLGGAAIAFWIHLQGIIVPPPAPAG